MTVKNQSIKTILQTEIDEFQKTPDLIDIIIDFLAQNELYYTESECIIKPENIMDKRKMSTLINDIKKIILQGKSYAIDVNKFKWNALKKIELCWYYMADVLLGFMKHGMSWVMFVIRANRMLYPNNPPNIEQDLDV